MKQTKSYYPNQIQLRFIEIADRENVKVQVYEREAGRAGAGKAGLCSKAVISTAYELGLVDRRVTVHTRDGEIEVEIKEDGSVSLYGADKRNTSVVLSRKMREQLCSR